MKTLRTEKYFIGKRHPAYADVDVMCFRSKNLFNSVLYILRTKFFEMKTNGDMKGMWSLKSYPSKFDLVSIMTRENHPAYREMGNTKVAQVTIHRVYDIWKAFIQSTWAYRKDSSKFKGSPRMPNYKNKEDGRYMAVFSNQAYSKAALRDRGTIAPAIIKHEWPFRFAADEVSIKEIRFTVGSAGGYWLRVVYERELAARQPNPDANGILYSAGCDLGVANLMTVASERGSSFIIDGKAIKHVNHMYNAYIASRQAALPKGVKTSKLIQSLWHRRDNKIRHIMHNISKHVLEKLYEEHCCELVIGKNDHWKTGVNLGRENNRKFVSIPFNTLTSYLAYKSEEYGIKVVFGEESYTSKASSIDKDVIPVYDGKSKHKFSGKRETRGVYVSKGGMEVNADANGAVNILRKHVTRVDSLEDYSIWVKGCVVSPVKERLVF